MAVDFRPPSSGNYSKTLGPGDAHHLRDIEKDPSSVGRYYRKIVDCTKQGLEKLPSVIPGYTEYELLGLGWHQGWNDRVTDPFVDEYEYNLANFIRDIRKSLGKPSLPVVIADTGIGGFKERDSKALDLMRAQRNVAHMPEFRDNVFCVRTMAFYRARSQSPTEQIYHWNGNAETYYLIGHTMGMAMKDLLAAK